MKTYHEVCIDIIKMLEELEESLDEINKETHLLDIAPKLFKEESELSWLERHFDFIKKSNS